MNRKEKNEKTEKRKVQQVLKKSEKVWKFRKYDGIFQNHTIKVIEKR